MSFTHIVISPGHTLVTFLLPDFSGLRHALHGHHRIHQYAYPPILIYMYIPPNYALNTKAHYVYPTYFSIYHEKILFLPQFFHCRAYLQVSLSTSSSKANAAITISLTLVTSTTFTDSISSP